MRRKHRTGSLMVSGWRAIVGRRSEEMAQLCKLMSSVSGCLGVALLVVSMCAAPQKCGMGK